MSRKLTTEEFIERSILKHGDKYDYSKVRYENTESGVIITCPDHGDFKQRPADHQRGIGCNECGKLRKTGINNGRATGLDAFIERAKLKHGNTYSYANSVYVNSRTKLTIVCAKHGEFVQNPRNHIRGAGCPKCKGTPNMGLDGFIEKAKLVHGSLYDYSEIKYTTNKEKVTIGCRVHGKFSQVAGCHIRGQGCPQCGIDNTSISNKITNETFIERAVKVHGDKYDYSEVEYVHSNAKVTIICPDHGEFEQTPGSHVNYPSGCPKCSNSGPSQAEQMIFELCQSYAPDVQQGNRKAIAPLELDIYIPSLKLAIEYNGNYWHSEQFRHKTYHQKKFLKCQEAGIRLFQIWEQDWIDPVKQDIILSMLQYKLGHNKRIYARKTNCHEVTYKMAKAFYNEHHLQGAGRCHSNQTHWGLFEGDTPVMMMSVDFKQNYIVRVATAKGLAVVGGASKLMKMLPSGDYMSYGSNDLGGSLTHYPNAKRTITEPRYYWWKAGEKIQRQSVQKHKLPKVFPDYDGSSERVWMESIGYHRVFDSGNTKLEFSIK